MPPSNEKRIRIANEEVLGKGNLDVVEQFFSDDYVLHSGGKDHRGRSFVRRFVKQLRSAIPDLRVVDITVLTKAGNTIVWQRTLRGTHKAKMKGIPPTGKRVEWRDLVVTRMKRGKIVEDWAVSDLAGQLLSKRPRATGA